MLLWTQRKSSRQWVRGFDQPQQAGLGRKCGGGPFYVALVSDWTLNLTAEMTTKSHSQSDSMCQKWPYASLREGESCYACALLVSLSVCGRWVLDGQEAAQLRVSIFINFKVFHTPHPFSFNNTVPQSHSVFIFLTLIRHVWWSRYQRETVQSYPNGNSTIKTQLSHSFTALRQPANPNSCTLISNWQFNLQ